jgi:hypothetical protein
MHDKGPNWISLFFHLVTELIPELFLLAVFQYCFEATALVLSGLFSILWYIRIHTSSDMHASRGHVHSSFSPNSVGLVSTEAQHSPFYRPLDKKRKEIRLLTVKAGFGFQQVKCEFKKAYLASNELKPSYETISYCWGDPSVTSILTLNGRKIKVPATAKTAIECMRLVHADRLLWIDAVCINQVSPSTKSCKEPVGWPTGSQQDRQERSHQVSFMDEIYSNNTGNLIYLGKGSKYIRQGIHVVEHVLRSARRETEEYETWSQALVGNAGEYKLSASGIDLPEDLGPLFHFFAAPWFGRLWVGNVVQAHH